jgi:hypothetical protein
LLNFDTIEFSQYGTFFRLTWTGEVLHQQSVYESWGYTIYSERLSSLQNQRGHAHAEFISEVWSGREFGSHTIDYMAAHRRFEGRYHDRWGRIFDLSGDPNLRGASYENRYILDQIHEGAVPTLDVYLESAYVEACNSLPRIATNNIANIGQVFSTFASFVKGYSSIPSMLDALKDSWLGYRYEYLTTKSDIDEIVSFVDRISSVGSVDLITGHGKVTFPSKDGSTYTVRCSVTLPPTMYQDVQSWAERFGVALDGYNMWDLIPYSFIIDWFLPIGSMLETARDADYAARLSPSEVWYSITHEFINSFGCRQCDYARWRGALQAPAALPITIIPELSSSGKTWVKRGSDLFALFS